jgi:hypothetical protein
MSGMSAPWQSPSPHLDAKVSELVDPRHRILEANTPAFAPVTMVTLPVRSGISSTLKVDFGG